MDLVAEPYSDGIRRVSVCGEVSQADFVTIAEPLGRQLGETCFQETLLLDLSGVSMLDSSGVGWLLLCHRRSRLAGGALVLHSLSPVVKETFDVLKLQLVLNVTADEAAALETARERRK